MFFISHKDKCYFLCVQIIFILPLCMHSISLELLPYFCVDVFYTNTTHISILKCEINGIRLNLNELQTQSIIDEIKDILKYDY